MGNSNASSSSKLSSTFGTLVRSINDNGKTLAVFVVFALVVIVLIIAFLVYRMRRSDLTASTLVKAPRRLYSMTNPYSVDAESMPATMNGQEYSFSMWLYITDFTTTERHKIIMMRGPSATLIDASPVVFMDKATNKLYISIRTNATPATGQDTLEKILISASSRFLTATIEYVPLQRWVNIAFVVQDNLLSVYMNGDMYTVENVYDLAKGTVLSRPVFAGIKGNVLIGKLDGTDSATAFISRAHFFNYALSPDDVRAISMEGPVPGSGIMGTIGISDYAVRTPIYRVGEDGMPVDE
jgi:hypothetical protein